MLDVFKHFVAFGMLLSLCFVVGVPHIHEYEPLDWVYTGFGITLRLFIIGEILAWSIWYLSGGSE